MSNKVQTSTRQAESRCYLILQGLGSPFFKVLAGHLSQDGGTVHKVNFCGGDWWFSGNAQNHRFNGPMHTLGDFYRTLIQTHSITHIIMFGDRRPIHKAALDVAKDLGLQCWIFEEGYTRPGFVTCENGGTNDLSPIPREPDVIRTKAKELTSEDTQGPALPNPMPRRVRMDLAHHLWTQLMRPLYFRYKTHRPDSMWEEIGGWVSRFRRKSKHNAINSVLIKRYEQAEKPFFFAPLQLNSDYQIREHSPYEGTLDFVRETIASFASNAPKSALLMFKSHPIDNGMIDYRSYIAMAALQHGVEGRVDYLEGGNLDVFLKKAQGIVLINSTVGFAALKKAKPVKVMGRALYDIPGITAQKTLDNFWGNPTAPDIPLVGDFLRVVRAHSQIPGDFFTREGIEMAAKGAFLRIKAETTAKQVGPREDVADAQLEEIGA